MAAVIRKAELTDVAAVVRLAKQLALESHGTDPPPNGFLVSGFEEEDYLKYVSDAEHFYVCVDSVSDALMGFLLAYSDQRLELRNRVEAELRQVYHTQEFVLIKQIAVDRDWQHQGVGTHLYQYLTERVPDVALLAAIVLVPPNPASIRFHDRLGFEFLLEVKADDGRPRGIWRKTPGAARCRSASVHPLCQR